MIIGSGCTLLALLDTSLRFPGLGDMLAGMAGGAEGTCWLAWQEEQRGHAERAQGESKIKQTG